MFPKTNLMISVTNGYETDAALEGGADIIDIKNPEEGALGAPSPATIEQVYLTLKGDKPFSIALGEFPGKPCAAALAALGSAHFKPDYIKIAFIPHQSPEEIIEILQEIKRSLRYCGEKSISLVSVTYADTLHDASWNLERFVAISKEGEAEGCLVDTWEKKNRSLLHYLTENQIQKFINDCHQLSLFCGLAGSLTIDDVQNLVKLQPDIIGVRSAVCGGDRLRGTVSSLKVSELKELFGHGLLQKEGKDL